MSAQIVNGAVQAASRVRDAEHPRAFKHAVRDFVQALSLVPDEVAGSVPADGQRVLQSMGQDVIDLIEERVADTPSASDAQELVSSVYEIRRLLEEVHRWRQHYAIARHV